MNSMSSHMWQRWSHSLASLIHDLVYLLYYTFITVYTVVPLQFAIFVSVTHGISRIGVLSFYLGLKFGQSLLFWLHL